MEKLSDNYLWYSFLSGALEDFDQTAQMGVIVFVFEQAVFLHPVACSHLVIFCHYQKSQAL